MKQEFILWDEEELSGRAHTYRTWPASDIKGVYDRFDELLNYVKKSTAPIGLSDEEIMELAEYHGINDWLYETSVTDFARAILKKASEK